MDKIVKARLVATVQVDLVVDEEAMKASPNYVKRGDAYEVVAEQVRNGSMMDALRNALKREFENANGDGFFMTTRADQTYADAWIVTKGEEN